MARAGDKLRITAQLINIADGYNLWSETYDQGIGDILAIRSEVAQRVADALQIELGFGARQRIKQNPTDNLEAYQLYLKARYFAGKHSRDGLYKSIEYFRQAVGLDPNFALAYVGLAHDHIMAWDRLLAPKDAMPEARAAATRAVALDDTLAEAHTWLATVYWWYDWEAAAEAEFKRGVALDRQSAIAHEFYGWYLQTMGRLDEDLVEARRMLELDPLAMDINFNAGTGFYNARRYDQAIDHLRRILDTDPFYWPAHLWLGRAHALKGEFSEALAELKRARQWEERYCQTIGRGSLPCWS